MVRVTDLERLRAALEEILLSGRRPTEPEVLEVSRRIDELVALEMRERQPAGRTIGTEGHPSE